MRRTRGLGSRGWDLGLEWWYETETTAIAVVSVVRNPVMNLQVEELVAGVRTATAAVEETRQRGGGARDRELVEAHVHEASS
jgi:hypothetical protein